MYPLTQSHDRAPPSVLFRDAGRPGMVRAFGMDQDAAEQVAMRQLRHQTKNALQRILGQVWKVRELQRTREGQQLLDEVEQRIQLSAEISNALFGLTRRPAPMEERLRHLCESTVALLADADQTIRLEVTVAGDCPEALRGTVLRVAHEMVGNAVKHGMHVRLLGRITVRLESDAEATRLTVRDDGWGPAPAGPAEGDGEGLALVAALAAQHGGTASLHRDWKETVAELAVPHTAALDG
ncbi:ATP-binding protein [Roseomonas sp. OT10]|uniref:ATP-binding protein n=1 Tax=Roseomonas cutis TaxID=2897332 RepID=UPI001E41D0B6|nr:ATP-binding protein [Roseomonas sp. OT10]UFN50960.1 ATP-binding protein [Roseomonas sp. OT10]